MPSPRPLFPLVALLLLLPDARGAEARARAVPDSRLTFLENGVIKLGVDLNRGGSIVFLARGGGSNLINNFDFGRQVQPSFFSGPVPFFAGDQRPAKHWEHIGWNPIQTGDDFKNASRVLAHENDGRSLYVKCVPMQWPLNHVPGDCTFEVWLTLDGPAVKARARLTNARTDHTQYPARLQELPAVYANAAFHRVVSYTGARPFTGDAVAEVPAATGKHPWSFWLGTEGWAALLDGNDEGLGLLTPGRVYFTGGFAGKPGPNDSTANSTGYLAGQALEILDHNIVFDFGYELVAGSLREIRDRAATLRPAKLPTWTFTTDRQGWHYRNATDQGWPLPGHLDVRLDQEDPQLISPHGFWPAADAPVLIIEAAFHTTQRQATLFWQTQERQTPDPAHMATFPIRTDGDFHPYVVRLADHPDYRGAITQLRFDPAPGGEPGAWVKVRSIRLTREP